MTNIEFTIRKICERRGKALTNIEKVAFNVRIESALANGTALLPIVGNTFYLVERIWLYANAVAGTPYIEINSNSGQGSVGTINFDIVTTARDFMIKAEVDSMLWRPNGMTGGFIYLVGNVFKVTHTA